MRTITLKNIPDDLYDLLKESAAQNRRSINSELLVCIERAVSGRRALTPDELVARARKLRAKTSHHPAQDGEFTSRKAAGRP